MQRKAGDAALERARGNGAEAEALLEAALEVCAVPQLTGLACAMSGSVKWKYCRCVGRVVQCLLRCTEK